MKRTRLLITAASGLESKASRELRAILEDARVVPLFMKGNLLVSTGLAENDAISKLMEADTKYIGKITPIDKRVTISKGKSSFDRIMKEVLSLEKMSASDTFLIECKRRGDHSFSSSELKKELGIFLESAVEATVDFDRPSKIVVVEIFQNTAFIGVSPAENIKRKEIKVFHKYPKGQRPLNRAELKIKEAIQHFEIVIRPEYRALDLGAAPGGWTKVLSSLAKEVVAVDPADLDPSVASIDNVVHLKCKAEELLDKNLGRFDIITNDMNLDPSSSAKIMCELADLLVDEGIAIMTVKFVTRDRWTHMQETFKYLEKVYGDFAVRRLPHNRFETTVVMRKKR